jgi:hypothetical protein
MTRYCPRGDGAFEDWIQTCPECGSPLRDTPDEEDAGIEIGDATIVWVANAANEVEAMMWASTLRAEGIPVLLRPGGPGAGAWASSATFEHGLYVREQDRRRAQATLNAVVRGIPPRARARRAAPRVRRRSLRTAG